MIGTSDRLCWLAETCKILLLLLHIQPAHHCTIVPVVISALPSSLCQTLNSGSANFCLALQLSLGQHCAFCQHCVLCIVPPDSLHIDVRL